MKTEEEDGKDGEGRGRERKSDPKRRRIDGKIHVRPSALTAPLFYTVAVAVVGRGREGKGTERVMAS